MRAFQARERRRWKDPAALLKRSGAGSTRRADGTITRATPMAITSDEMAMVMVNGSRAIAEPSTTAISGLTYVDTTRSGTRRWCEMKVCGNPNKVRRFRVT